MQRIVTFLAKMTFCVNKKSIQIHFVNIKLREPIFSNLNEVA